MSEEINKTISGFYDIGKSVASKLYITSLHDTPTGYLGHSGDYLVVNDNESGVHFTGIEKIASDLIDYGFSSVETLFFTGLKGTPTGYESGYYLRSTETGIEYISSTGLAADIGKSIDFTGFKDTPSDYQSGYFVKSTSSGMEYSERVVDKYDSPPTDVIEGKLIEVDCVLYMGCNGNWVDISKINDPVDEPPAAIPPTFEPPSDPSECSFGRSAALYPPESIYDDALHHYSNYNFTTLISHRGSLSYYAFFNESNQAWEYQGYWPVNHIITAPSFSADGKIVAYQNRTTNDSSFYVYQYKESTKTWVQLGSTINNAGWNARNTGFIDGPWEHSFAINLAGNRVTWIKESEYFINPNHYHNLWIRSAIWNGSDWEMLPDLQVYKDVYGSQAIEPRYSPTQAPTDPIMRVQWSENADVVLYLNKQGTYANKWRVATLSSGGNGNTWTFETLDPSWINGDLSLSKNGKHIAVYYDDAYYNVFVRFISKINGVWTYRGERNFTHPYNAETRELKRFGEKFVFMSDDGNSFAVSNAFVYGQYDIAGETKVRWSDILYFWDESLFPNPGWTQVARGDHLEYPSKTTSDGRRRMRQFSPGEHIGCYTSNLSRFTRGNTHFTLDGACAQEYLDTETEISSNTTSFVDLQDAPDTLEGAANSIVKVNSESDGLEFQDIQNLTEQISQTIVNDNLIKLDTDYSFQTKYLNGSISSDSNITDLEFTNLTIGDTYRLSSTVSINSDGTAGDKIKVNYYHDGNKIAAVYSDNISQSVSTSVLFNATSNSLSVSGQNLDVNNYIEGNPNEITFTQVEKISNNMIAPEIIAITDGSTQTFNGATMADNNYIKIEGENVSATIEIDGDSFVVAQSGDQMVWDQGGAGETTLSLGDVHSITLSSGRIIEIKFYRSGSLYFSLDKKYEPPSIQCASSPVTITVESEYDSETSTSTFKYITRDSSGNGGLFGCIDANRGETLTIFVTGDEPNLLSHPLKITNFNDLGQAMAPLSGVVKTDLTEGPTEDHTYSLTWVVPCDETIDKYQYQCENHAHMKGTINVFGTCPSPTPTPTPSVTSTPSVTPSSTPVVTPTVTPTPSTSSIVQNFDTFPSSLPFKLR